MNVTLGQTGVVTNKNAFGVLPIQRVDFDTAATLLLKAYNAGFTYFDTARGYSDSEEKIGKAFKGVERSSYILATKTPSQNAPGFWRDLETSLAMLQTDYIDVYQFHNPGFVPRPGDGTGLYEAMLEAKSQGKIRHIGITNHRLPIATEAVESGLYETLQFPFSYLSGEKEIALVKLCEANNVGFVCMKALSGGLITNSAAAFAWLAQYPNALPIWGIQRETELDEFISYMSAPPMLSGELLELVERDRAELSGDFCRGCGYCQPGCPANIQVSMAARMSLLLRRSPAAGWLTEQSQTMMRKINDCVNCGQCTEACPYDLDTPALLKKNLADYESFIKQV
jgi:predicted aldo/keto reductase-like oxidoreductase